MHDVQPAQIGQLVDSLRHPSAAMRSALLDGMSTALPRQAQQPSPIALAREPVALTKQRSPLADPFPDDA